MSPSGVWQSLLKGILLVQGGTEWEKTHLSKRLARNSEQGGNTRETGEAIDAQKGRERAAESQR